MGHRLSSEVEAVEAEVRRLMSGEAAAVQERLMGEAALVQGRSLEATAEELEGVHLRPREAEVLVESWTEVAEEVRFRPALLAVMVEARHWPVVQHELAELVEEVVQSCDSEAEVVQSSGSVEVEAPLVRR